MDETTQTIAAAQKLEDATAAAAGLEPRPLTTTWWRWSRMLRAELPGDGDLAQADEMFRGVAWRWRFLAMKGGARDEMLTLGLLGLFRAAVNFDPRRKVLFSTYAPWWVRVELQRSPERRPLIQVPNNMVHALSRLKRTRAQADAAGLGRDQGITTARFAAAQAAFDIGHLDAPMTRDGKDTWVARVPAPNGLPSHALEEKRRHADTHAALGQLDRRSRLIVTRRFGLDGKPPNTLAELGKRLGLTKERVRQIERAALDLMREHLHHHQPGDWA